MADLDPRQARRRFERAARSYAGASRLEAEVAERMLERLDYVKLAPRRVLDAGSGPGRDAPALAARYPRARLIALDFSLAMLREIPAPGLLARLAGRRALPDRICADFSRLPLRGRSIGLVWSNMALHWAAEPLAVLREYDRVLEAEGLLMFSTLGPDTLAELRAAAGEQRVHRFVDMHDLGDMLVAAGFSAPVMSMEKLTVAYARIEQLLDDLRGSGQTSARLARPRGLAGARSLARLRQALEAQRREATLGVTFEVVYGHAWKGARAEDGRAIVRFERARTRPSSG